MRIPKNDHSVRRNQGDSTVVGVVEVREEESEAMALCAAWRAAGGEGTMRRIVCGGGGTGTMCRMERQPSSKYNDDDSHSARSEATNRRQKSERELVAKRLWTSTGTGMPPCR